MKNSRVNISAHAHHGTRMRRDVGERRVRERDEDLVGDRIEQAAEHGRAVLAGEHAVDPVGAADQRARDQRAPQIAIVVDAGSPS